MAHKTLIYKAKADHWFMLCLAASQISLPQPAGLHMSKACVHCTVHSLVLLRVASGLGICEAMASARCLSSISSR